MSRLQLRNLDREHPILHGRLHLVRIAILGQHEGRHEPAAAALHVVPPIAPVLLLDALLAGDLEHPTVVQIDRHLLSLEPREVELEDVGGRGLSAFDPRSREGRRRHPSCEVRAQRQWGAEGLSEVGEWVPRVEGDRVREIGGSPVTRVDGHDCLLCNSSY